MLVYNEWFNYLKRNKINHTFLTKKLPNFLRFQKQNELAKINITKIKHDKFILKIKNT
jgi:hypothetical protein